LSARQSPPAEVSFGRRKFAYLTIAYLSTGLGIAGAFLPLLPTTPFLLLAAWAAAKGSPALHRWLYEHPTFGAALIAWETRRAVPTSAKWLACSFMAISWLIMYARTSGPLVPTLTGIGFLCVAGFITTRPAA
jgi:uncharacterized membrane protein YbaN (DUF454 family)